MLIEFIVSLIPSGKCKIKFELNLTELVGK